MPPTLYRGIPKNTKRGREALRGAVVPRGNSTDYLEHVLGGTVDTDATSWTYDEQVARRFGELILADEDDVRHRIVTPHLLPGRYSHEKEVLLRGSIFRFKIL